ncbi:PucR family transcriptional regulator [Amycolatopsis acidicola]|uniref:PucR family transcriptional regulator n=1 Tax=Amycolatopsis acidicola TaxID=2596893 RepID=A0A5N0V380_9PSEU|nr:PucR family transcriptional regulator [Amycolatopsis acidicola]KAA9159752.1 PucR family transcriptional regulator [Amycolatopsis acidicola]
MISGSTAALIRDDVLAAVGRSVPGPVAERVLADYLAAVATGFEWTEERRGYYAQHADVARAVLRALWRHLEVLAREGHLQWDAVWRLGDIALAAQDEIDASAAGHRRLLEQLLSEKESERRAAQRTARQVGWPMPETLCMVVLTGQPTELPAGALADLRREVPRVLVPDPDGQAWARCFQGPRAVVGPVVPSTEAVRSLEQALEVGQLVQAGFVAADDVVWCDEHLRALLLMRNRGLIRQLGDRTLAPLKTMEPKKRARSWETLLAWLRARGNLAEVAEILRLHPQTVRYRMKELHRLYGESLDDPGFRLDLELALRGLAALYAGQVARDGVPPLVNVLRARGLPDLADEYSGDRV